jgi:hypothetical protein
MPLVLKAQWHFYFHLYKRQLSVLVFLLVLETSLFQNKNSHNEKTSFCHLYNDGCFGCHFTKHTEIIQAVNHGNKFEQMGSNFPTPNEYRTASGAPGPKYWQQRCDYDIKCELDEKEPEA